MANLQAAIFDWAGTTVDYGCFAPVQAFVEVFRERGIEPTMAEVRGPMGMLKRDHIKTMLNGQRISALWQQRFGAPWQEADLDEMYGVYERKLLLMLENYATPKPHVLEAVATLRGMGISIGSTTGYNDKMMALVVESAKKQGYAPDTWCSPDGVGGTGRPYPYMVFENMRRLGCCDVRRVIKVGDTVSDIQEGKNAGVITIGIVEGSSEMGLTQAEYEGLSPQEQAEHCQRVAEIYRSQGADFVLRHMGHLPQLIEQLGT